MHNHKTTPQAMMRPARLLLCTAALLVQGWAVAQPAAAAAKKEQFVPNELQVPARNAALAPLKLKAESGDPAAQVEYAKTLHQSFNDPAEAFRWMERAASQKYPEALYALSLYHLNGWGCPKNPALAFQFMQAAAEAGHAWGQLDLGLYYLKGQGTKPDLAKTVKWVSKAAATGLPQAQYEMGVLYLNGEGVKQDFEQSLAWFTKAGKQNHPDAIFYAGAAIYQGLGVAKDPARGLDIMQDAMKMGSRQAQANIHKYPPVAATRP